MFVVFGWLLGEVLNDQRPTKNAERGNATMRALL